MFNATYYVHAHQAFYLAPHQTLVIISILHTYPSTDKFLQCVEVTTITFSNSIIHFNNSVNKIFIWIVLTILLFSSKLLYRGNVWIKIKNQTNLILLLKLVLWFVIWFVGFIASRLRFLCEKFWLLREDFHLYYEGYPCRCGDYRGNLYSNPWFLVTSLPIFKTCGIILDLRK